MKLKKVAALGLATAMAFSVTACSSSKPAETTAAAADLCISALSVKASGFDGEGFLFIKCV